MFKAGLLIALLACLQAQPPVAASFAWPAGKRVAVSMSFDDARASQVQGGTALLDRFGVKATFYLTASSIEPRLAGWKQATANGHEMANHSLNHPCSGNFDWSRTKALEDYTLERIRFELVEANRKIKELLGVTAESFAYPCGQRTVGRGLDTRSYVPITAALFVSSRGWLDEAPNDPVYVDLAQITGIESDGKDFEQILSVIDSAKKTGAWVVFAGHDIGKEGRQTTRVAMLEKLCAYVTDPANEVWVAPVATIARYVRDHRDRKFPG